ncbi:MAG: Spy/CpxP family protein refolding chaperone [Bacteroidota bacterium]
MKTQKKNYRKGQDQFKSSISLIKFSKMQRTRFFGVLPIVLLIGLSSLFARCKKDTVEDITTPATSSNDQYTITQAISDEAQRNTIAFDGLAYLTGNLGSQSFLPPGKVADYSGFQYLRDNDPTMLGHNTSFVTIIAFNILHILSTDQINMFVARAQNQIDQINEFALKRYPLLKAFRRLKESDIPTGSTGLSKEAVMAYAAEFYRIDGLISYDRAKLFGAVVNSFSTDQKAKMDALKALNGVGNWDSGLSNPLEGLNLPQDVNVAVMTYASEMYAWYAGSVTSDVYFCPERHGTYFGSFYLKDWPAMGNPNYTIDETLTASAGQNFLAILTTAQADQIKAIVELQRSALNELVAKREAVSTELRKFLALQTADSSAVIALSERYGELDGEISYYYATTFSQVYNTLSDEQKTKLTGLADQLGYINPDGAFQYSQPIAMPEIMNTDFMFK